MAAPSHISEDLKAFLTNMDTSSSARISRYDDVTVTIFDSVDTPAIYFADEDGVITSTEALTLETSASDVEALIQSKGFTVTTHESQLGSVFRKMNQ